MSKEKAQQQPLTLDDGELNPNLGEQDQTEPTGISLVQLFPELEQELERDPLPELQAIVDEYTRVMLPRLRVLDRRFYRAIAYTCAEASILLLTLYTSWRLITRAEIVLSSEGAIIFFLYVVSTVLMALTYTSSTQRREDRTDRTQEYRAARELRMQIMNQLPESLSSEQRQAIQKKLYAKALMGKSVIFAKKEISLDD